MIIKVKYDQETSLVKGYFPSEISYKNNMIDTKNKTIDGEPYIEITQEDWESSRDKKMIVENGIYKEYIKPDSILLQEAKKEAIANRIAYLNSTDWYILREYDQSNSYPQEIKDKRIIARTEINQIEQETNINNIVIDFS